ncbi:alpha/beta hydrolase [Kordia zhangzhouensis]|uniref:alpha/beta hydrolase n=1 Tax=Kordia zhangzhouensis TaxID=1620405 RepID=UPI0006290842|nr:alpha/beta hydrolase-fold protein [Kordia zhangzhouensis]
MKHFLMFFVALMSFSLATAQVKVEQFSSKKLNETRDIQLYIPEGYSEEKVYPIIVVLDAHYLFESVVANTRFYSYWDEMPESIVVGINQYKTEDREKDVAYDDDNGLPKDKGNQFFEFIGMELIPFVEKNYNTANFKMIIGHDLTANFANYYLLKEAPLFDAYINLSPSFAPKMEERIAKRLEEFEKKKFYYLATAEEDTKKSATKIRAFNATLKNLKNENIFYYYDDFTEANHNSLAVQAIPRAMSQIFSMYRPISVKEYKEKILNLTTSPYLYLNDKYETIKNLFGFEKRVTVNDFMAIYSAVRRDEKNTEDLKLLAKLGKKEYPDTALFHFFMGEYYEKTEAPKKALRMYQNGFSMNPIDFITKDLMLDKADKLKQDFGW